MFVPEERGWLIRQVCFGRGSLNETAPHTLASHSLSCRDAVVQSFNSYKMFHQGITREKRKDRQAGILLPTRPRIAKRIAWTAAQVMVQIR